MNWSTLTRQQKQRFLLILLALVVLIIALSTFSRARQNVGADIDPAGLPDLDAGLNLTRQIPVQTLLAGKGVAAFVDGLNVFTGEGVIGETATDGKGEIGLVDGCHELRASHKDSSAAGQAVVAVGIDLAECGEGAVEAPAVGSDGIKIELK